MMQNDHERRADFAFIIAAIYYAPSMSEPVRIVFGTLLTLLAFYHWWKSSKEAQP